MQDTIERTLEVDQHPIQEMANRQAELLAAEETIAEDIDDFIDENSFEEASTSEEVNQVLSRIEELRTGYRAKHNEFKNTVGEEAYNPLHNEPFDARIGSIKDYILLGKERRKQLRVKETGVEKVEKDSKIRSQKFFLKEINMLVLNLEKQFGIVHTKEFTDDDISRLKNEIPNYLKKLDDLSKLIKDLLNCTKVGDVEVDNEIIKITKNYDVLCNMKDEHVQFIKNEARLRELSKKELFNEGRLKIHLPKFGGYESRLDVYSFQSEFNKLHERTTPKRLLSDLLKNNFLEGAALSLVSSIDDIDEIWERLKLAYGDAKLLLKKKLGEVEKVNHLWKFRDPEKIANSLSNLINIMKDLMKLASEHSIDSKLYCGDGLERIYGMLGDFRLTNWLTQITDKKLSDKQLWLDLIKFLENDLKVQQQKLLLQNKCGDSTKQTPKVENRNDRYKEKQSSHFTGDAECLKCHFCDEKDHVATNGPNGTKLVQYFACKKFTEMTPNERFLALKEKGLCIQCLFPGAFQNKRRHEQGYCQRDFTCQHQSHNKYPVRKHVLVCHEHRNNKENKELLETYKKRCINKEGTNLPQFSRDIKLSFHSSSYTNCNLESKQPEQDSVSTDEKAIYMLQTIVVDNHEYSVFYDTGCSEMVSRFEAIKSIGKRATQEQEGPIILGGVGNSQVVSYHGIYQITLPLFNGENAKLSGVCMDKITTKFPMYPLQGKVEEDIEAGYRNAGKDIKLLPRLPKTVGGDTDFMVGIKYYRYYPDLIFQLPSGLSIYKSWFLNPDGSRGVIGGPHAVFTKIEAQHYDAKSFTTSQYALFRFGYQVNPDISLLHFKASKNFLTESIFTDEIENVSSYDKFNQSNINSFITAVERKFQIVEDTGSEISYRCSNCRNCKNCKNHENIENVSLREEVEQDLINRSVAVDIEKRVTVASLPFIHDPSIKLSDNKDNALRVYNQQLKKLDKNPKDKLDVLKAEAMLQNMNYVEFVENLPPEDQEMLQRSPTKYYIPWRIVWNQNSVTTPCRPVFDASQSTSTGFSLNDVLAKGKNNMNRLLEIVIRWSSHLVGFHTDIRKMYNSVQLRKEDWCYQRYIWQENLDKKKLPVEKVIKTLIYGVRPSGNQAERGIRETARLSKEKYPEISKIVCEDIYVDDCLSGGRSKEEAFKLADALEIVLNCGGFSLKGVTFSGKAPPENLSSDGSSINVAGMKWNPVEDVLSLDINKLNFAKKVRGKKPVRSENVIPDVLTRRHCVSKVAEIFDLTGKITPITSTMKLDLHELIIRQLDWDDAIPDELRPVWTSHFEMMEEIRTLKYKRAVVPDDAMSLDVETVDFGDASSKICCSAIYARFLRRDGTYSSQLVFSRSKIISSNTTQPRAELLAATLNTHTGEVVRRSFGKHHKGNVKVTDSEIVLYWIHNETKTLKQWVRNRIVEIKRFTDPSDWRYTQSKAMLADIGTRRVDDLKLVDQNSVWINGFNWMQHEKSFFSISINRAN